VAEVAASIIFTAVLMTALAPTLGSVRVSSKDSRCFSNLMQISYANIVYASRELSDPALPVHEFWTRQCGDDYVGVCARPSFIGAYEWGGKSGTGRGGFKDYPGALGSRYGTNAGFGPATRPLNEVLYKKEFADALEEGEFNRIQAQQDMILDLPEVRCPADTGYSGIHFPDFRDEKKSSFDYFGTSYTANMFMTANSGGGEMKSNSPYLHRLSGLTNTSRTLAYYENNGRFAWSAAPMPPSCRWIGQNFDGTVTGWHGLPWVYNAAFIDGHADRIYMRSFKNPLAVDDPDLQSSSRCIIVRGENWNKDTLPVPRVPSAVSWGGGGRPSWEGGIQ